MSKFRTIELSDPRFESNHLRFITVKTSSLKGRGDICVFVPPGIRAGETIPVIILLHGVYGSAWSWSHCTGVHLQTMEMITRGEIPPVILAMPSDGLWGDGSAYLYHNGYNFEEWIAKDVVEVLTESITGAGKNSPLFIAGLSMGGFGALRIGAKYGQQFRGIAAHSSITNLTQMKLFVEESLDHYVQQEKVDEDVFKTFFKYREHLPPVRFDCGTSDQLIEYNRALHAQLSQHKIPHEYEEYDGAHEWSYWEKHIRQSILFFMKQL
jgi:putative tributyrin esterase